MKACFLYFVRNIFVLILSLKYIYLFLEISSCLEELNLDLYTSSFYYVFVHILLKLKILFIHINQTSLSNKTQHENLIFKRS